MKIGSRIAITLSLLAAFLAAQPRDAQGVAVVGGSRSAIADQHPPDLAETRTEITRLDGAGWATRTFHWCETAGGGHEFRACEFVAGDWSDDGVTLLFVTIMSDQQANFPPGYIEAKKKALYNDAVAGCCPGWVPPQPPCVNFGWSLVEIMPNADGTPGGFSVWSCCIDDAPSGNPGCKNVPGQPQVS